MNHAFLQRASGLAGILGGLLFMLDFTLVGWLIRGGRLAFLGERTALARTTLWCAVSLALAAAAAGPRLAGATGGASRIRRLGDVGLALTLLGAAAYIAGSLYIFLTPGGLTKQLFTPAGSLLITLGMMGQTLSIVRAGVWRGWRRVASLPLAFYFPLQLPVQIVFFLGAGRGPNPWLLGLWGLGWMLLGWAVRSSVREDRSAAPAAARRRKRYLNQTEV